MPPSYDGTTDDHLESWMINDCLINIIGQKKLPDQSVFLVRKDGNSNYSVSSEDSNGNHGKGIVI